MPSAPAVQDPKQLRNENLPRSYTSLTVYMTLPAISSIKRRLSCRLAVSLKFCYGNCTLFEQSVSKSLVSSLYRGVRGRINARLLMQFDVDQPIMQEKTDQFPVFLIGLAYLDWFTQGDGTSHTR